MQTPWYSEVPGRYSAGPIDCQNTNGQSEPFVALEALPHPPGIPLMGNLFQIRPDRIHLILEDWARKYGGLYRIKVISRTLLVVSDLRMVTEVLKARPSTFRRSSRIESVFGEMGISGLLSAEGEQWHRQRRLTAYAFNPNHLRNYFQNLARIVDRLRLRWLHAAHAGASIDIQVDLMSYAMEATAGLAFGAELDSMEGQGEAIKRSLGNIFPIVNRRINAPFPYWRYLGLPSDRTVDGHLRDLRSAVHALTERTRVRMAANPLLFSQPTNLIEAFIAERDRPGSQFTDEDVQGNLLTTLLVGADGTANVCGWIIYFLSEYPNAQATLQAEADAVLKSEPILKDCSLVSRFPYAEAIAQEAMRLKPPGPLVFLEAKSDTTIGGLRIPAGTPVIALTRLGGLDPRHFPEPNTFDPGRWVGVNCGAGRSSSCHHLVIPFGAGPRICPGRHLGLMLIKLLVTMVGRNFEIGRSSRSPVEEQFKFTMGPKQIAIVLKQRS